MTGGLRKTVLWSQRMGISVGNAFRYHLRGRSRNLKRVEEKHFTNEHRGSTARPLTVLQHCGHGRPTSLHRLRWLWITSGRLPTLGQIGIPSNFQHTLTVLVLERCCFPISALVTVINYFINLSHPGLFDLGRAVDNQPTPPLSRPLRKLSVGDSFHCTSRIDELLVLRPKCDEVTPVTSLACPSLAQRVVDGVERSVKCLDLLREPKCMQYLRILL